MRFVVLIFGIWLISQSVAAKTRYDNYRVYSVNVENADHLSRLESIQNKYDFWKSGTIGHQSDIMVAPHEVDEFEKFIEDMNSSLKVDNVQRLIDLESNSTREGTMEDFGWTSYHTHSEIYAWLDTLLLQYPTILTNYYVGSSFEGRQIRAVRLSRKEGNPSIFIEANIHAREWITSATATWLLNELLTSTDPVVQVMSNEYDWIIVPIVNVDGFVHTQTQRTWRKTRQSHSLFCYGADPNRNFDAHWLYNDEGASKNPCSSSYAGPYPFSEPEIQALSQFYLNFAPSVKMYLAFHSYGQYILLPYGYTFVLPRNYHDMMSIGLKGQAALRTRYGADYILGGIHSVMYTSTGSSLDWAFDVGNVPLAFAFEFRDVLNGGYGFILPPDQIIPNCEEFMDGLKAMIAEAVRLNYF
ncbi:Zinc carboxypeptidase A 1 [Pseudolycoriella hygida]|uniref:Zinc carboxypeptidase A 1 n=1 Tax=Pseudolycoriella hygida TaxID=35572 RepID=A0A9Q0NG56_9DIPT|nr:Zinc carboxypeptidase A 1 [Pseudolycoriella hygida]